MDVKKDETLFFRFDERKAAAAATVLLECSGGRAQHLRVMKLLYLADREAIRRWNAPIVGGEYCSMKLGPVLSNALDVIKNGGTVWDKHIKRPTNYTIAVSGKPNTRSLSKMEIDLLREIWTKCEDLETYRLCRTTHALPEYTHTEHSSIRIAPQAIMRALKKSPEETALAAREAAHQAYMAHLVG